MELVTCSETSRTTAAERSQSMYKPSNRPPDHQTTRQTVKQDATTSSNACSFAHTERWLPRKRTTTSPQHHHINAVPHSHSTTTTHQHDGIATTTPRQRDDNASATQRQRRAANTTSSVRPQRRTTKDERPTNEPQTHTTQPV